MRKFKEGKRVGLRSKETGKLLAVYPHNLKSTDKETDKAVRDWYYQTSCEAEDELLNAYVDILTDEELKSRKL